MRGGIWTSVSRELTRLRALNPEQALTRVAELTEEVGTLTGLLEQADQELKQLRQQHTQSHDE